MTVYSAYITLKNGHRIYAANYGLKAFCFEVNEPKDDDTSKEADDTFTVADKAI